MGNKLSTEEKPKVIENLNIEVFLVKYNILDETYTTIRINKNNFDREYDCYIENNIDSRVINKDIFILHNKLTSKFNILGETDENEKIIDKKYIEDVLGINS